MTSGNQQDKSKKLLLALIFLSGIILYLPSIYVEFVADEIAFIKRNEVETISALPGAFAQKEYDGDYYRPLGNFVSGLITLAGNYNPEFYRIFNLLINALNGILLYLFLLRLFKDNDRKKLISFFGALFFVSFPLNDYAVIWHTDLFDRIMTLFYLLALIFFLNDKKIKLWSLFFFLLALLSKEMAFSLPLVILLMSYFTGKNRSVLSSIYASLPYFGLLALFLLFRWVAFDNNIFNLQDAHAGAGITTIIKNIILFWGMLVFPFFLRGTQELISSQPLILVIVIPAVLAVLYYLYKYRSNDLLLIFLILFVIVTILPASRLLMRWYLYLPSAGFAALLSYALLGSPLKLKTALITSLMIFTIYYAYTLYRQNLWIDVSVKGKSTIAEMIIDHNEDLKNAEKIYFLTVPAKVNDISLFQLGFDHHLNHFMNDRKQIYVLTKSYFEDIESETILDVSSDTYNMRHTGDNYFILSGNEKNIKFHVKEFKNRYQEFIYTKEKEPDAIYFTFSKGKFHLIEESK